MFDENPVEDASPGFVRLRMIIHTAMTIGEILIWEATNGLLLIPVVIALMILTRWIRGRPVVTQRDSFFLFGQTHEKVFSVHFWLRFVVLWCSVVLIGFVEGYVLLPFGIAAFLGAVFLTALVVVWRVHREGKLS
jgi:hypothetical protein